MDDDERTGPMPTPNGEDSLPKRDQDADDVRGSTNTDIDLTRLMRDIANEAHQDRRRYFVLTMSVVFAVFAFRQFIPPVWTLWM